MEQVVGAFLAKVFRLCTGFREERGTVAVLFALSIAPLTFLVGAALDYSGAANLKTLLQKATDGTGLRLCQVPNNPTVSDLQTVAANMMTSYLGAKAYTIESVNIQSNPRSIEIQTKSNFATSIVKIMNTRFADVEVKAYAKCFGEPQTFEIALVLDNTGSMSLSGGSQTKMEGLRQAAKDFVSFIYDNPVMAANTRIAIVPFATSVAVNPSSFKNAAWIDSLGAASYHWNNVAGSKVAATAAGFTSRFDLFTQLKAVKSSWDWAGCFESLPYPLNVTDVYPTVSNVNSFYVPHFSPDEAGEGGEEAHKEWSTNIQQYYVPNSYIDDETNQAGCGSANMLDKDRTLRACKYKSAKDATSTAVVLDGQKIGDKGPNFGCTTRPITRLTNVRKTLEDAIAAMQPSGTTNIHEGVMWGWRVLSPVSVLKDGAADEKPAPYAKLYNNKIIVLMTDGDNTWLGNGYNTVQKSFISAYGYYVNSDGSKAQDTGLKRLSTAGTASPSPASDADANAAMDKLTIESCKNARASLTTNGPEKINIYTVGFSTAGNPIDQSSINMLATCAGSSSRAFVANDSASLIAIFKRIAGDIGNLRLTQ